MAGYFQEMVEHELGHNLGLRHNFHGNLGAKPGPATFEGVSHSVMEYLGRGFRHLDRIGPYDVMAIGYGYAGKKPDKLNLFCTDEDVAIESNLANSAECSRDDATNDPFSYLTSRVKRAVTLVLAPESTAKPVFAVKDIEGQLATAVKGLALYAGSAELTASKWQNFFTGGSRPADASGVKGYVVSELKGLLCDPKFADIVAAKVDDEAKQATEANITALREKAGQVVTLVRGLSSADLACTTTP